jgi:hypothetical protein
MRLKTTLGNGLVLGLFLCLYAGCGTGPVEDPAPPPAPTPIDPGAPTAFEAIKPIVDRECVRCHGGRQAPDLRREAGFNSPRVKNEITTGDMPPDKRLSAADKGKLLAYFGR